MQLRKIVHLYVVLLLVGCSTNFPVCAVVCVQTGKWTLHKCASNYGFHYKQNPIIGVEVKIVSSDNKTFP